MRPSLALVLLFGASFAFAWLMQIDTPVAEPGVPTQLRLASPDRRQAGPALGDQPTLHGVNAFDLAFAGRQDLHELLITHQPAALQGDAESRWLMVEVLRYCGEHLASWTEPFDRARFLSWVAERGHDGTQRAEVNATAESLCHGFRSASTGAHGSVSGWFQLALADRHPLAVLELAWKVRAWHQAVVSPHARAKGTLERMEQSHLAYGVLAAARVELGEAPGDPVHARARLHALLTEAARSGRPDVWLRIGLRSPALTFGETARIERIAWLRLACTHGYPCADDAHPELRQTLLSFAANGTQATSLQEALDALHPSAMGKTVADRATTLERLISQERWDETWP